ncbi:MAG: B12-binding domain-containing radical SAM protein [bacterium]
MKICFIYPSYIHHAEANPELKEFVFEKSYLGTTSLSIPILAALTPEHHEIIFIDERIEPIPYDEPFNLVAMPVFTPSAERVIKISQEFRSRNVKVVVGGIFSSLMPSEISPYVDSICIGEGEPVWQKILEDMEKGRLEPIYKSKRFYDLNQSSVPRYDLLFEKERPNGYQRDNVDYNIQLCRGCFLECLACVIPQYLGKNMRFVPPKLIAKSIEAIQKDGHKRKVCLIDDQLSFPRPIIQEHLLEVVKLWQAGNISVSYTGISPAQALVASSEYFGCLRKLNTIQNYVVFGFDRFSRKAFQKSTDLKSLQKCYDAVKRIKDEGLEVYASLLVGHDEEDESVFDKILNFTEKAKINIAEFVILTPYPGTPLWNQMVKEDRIISKEWRYYNDANPTFLPKNYSVDRLRQGYIYLWKEFYRNKKRESHVLPIQI